MLTQRRGTQNLPQSCIQDGSAIETGVTSLILCRNSYSNTYLFVVLFNHRVRIKSSAQQNKLNERELLQLQLKERGNTISENLLCWWFTYFISFKSPNYQALCTIVFPFYTQKNWGSKVLGSSSTFWVLLSHVFEPNFPDILIRISTSVFLMK